MLGRSHFRRLHAVSRRGSVGTSARPSERIQKDKTSDAPSGAESSGLSPLLRRRSRRLRPESGIQRYRHYPYSSMLSMTSGIWNAQLWQQKKKAPRPAGNGVHHRKSIYAELLENPGTPDGGHGGRLHLHQDYGRPALHHITRKSW